MTLATPGLPILFALYIAPLCAQCGFENPNLPLQKRVDSILSRMTLDEKIACLNTNSGVPRLHIPDAGGFEGLHGLVRNGGFEGKAVPTTSFAHPRPWGHGRC